MKLIMFYFILVLEINPTCANVTCLNGGSCTHINETNTNVCVCNFEFTGEFCEGIIFTNIHVLSLSWLILYSDIIKLNIIYAALQ